MAAYCNTDEVGAECNLFGGFTAATTPTVDTVASFITQTQARIDARLALKYTMPVADAGALLVLKAICLAIVASRCNRIMTVKTGDQKLDQDPYQKAEMAAWTEVDAIVAGTIRLPNTTTSTVDDGVKTHVNTGCSPFFKRDEKQW